MKFYTNVAAEGNNIIVRGFNDGRRFAEKVQYQPSLYTRSKNITGPFKTVKGEPVERQQFKSIGDARRYAKLYENVDNMQVYGMQQWVYPYIFENYGRAVEADLKYVRIANIDIEVNTSKYSLDHAVKVRGIHETEESIWTVAQFAQCETPTDYEVFDEETRQWVEFAKACYNKQSGFPKPEQAAKEITAITIRLKGKSIIFEWDKRPYTASKGAKHFRAESEEQMLLQFLDVWQNTLDVDVVIGWNVLLFDMSYIINRLTNLFGEKAALRLSPWGKILWREVTYMGRTNHVPTIQGISVLDYMDMYKKFLPGSRESFTLEYIGKYEEVPIQKIDYKAAGYKDLNDLYLRNYQMYMDYNEADVLTVEGLDQKLKLTKLAMSMAYSCSINYNDSLTSVRLWDVSIHNYLMERNIVVPQLRQREEHGGIEGAYVKDPITGRHRWVVIIDFVSLYPTLIRQLNISPETLLGTYKAGLTVDDFLNHEFDPRFVDIKKQLTDNNCGIAASGCVFDNDVEGFLSALMTEKFNQRVEYRVLLKGAKERLVKAKLEKADKATIKQIEDQVATYDTAQASKKVEINAGYGGLLNKGNRWFDPRLGSSITLTGQLVSKHCEIKLNEFLNQYLKTENVGYCIYIDTDSSHLTLQEYVDQYCQGMTNYETTEKLNKFSEDILLPFCEKILEEFAEMFNHRQKVLKYSRECIASVGIFTGKKHYVYNVLDTEGFRHDPPKLKMMGIEAVKSSTPRAAREKIKEAIKVIVESDEREFQQFIESTKQKFFEHTYEEIAFPRSCNNIKKYSDARNIFGKGCPIHVRGSLIYNDLVKRLNLEDKCRLIEEGDKIKFCHLLMPNPTHSNIIACPAELPEELGLHKYIDYSKQFELGFLAPLESFAKVLNWHTEEQPNLEQYFVYYDD
jgi:DNA polymerase elongation subunit (family B)